MGKATNSLGTRGSRPVTRSAAIGTKAIKGNKTGAATGRPGNGPVPGTVMGGASVASRGGNPRGAGASRIAGGKQPAAGRSAGRKDGGPAKQQIGVPARGIGLTGNH